MDVEWEEKILEYDPNRETEQCRCIRTVYNELSYLREPIRQHAMGAFEGETFFFLPIPSNGRVMCVYC